MCAGYTWVTGWLHLRRTVRQGTGESPDPNPLLSSLGALWAAEERGVRETSTFRMQTFMASSTPPPAPRRGACCPTSRAFSESTFRALLARAGPGSHCSLNGLARPPALGLASLVRGAWGL